MKKLIRKLPALVTAALIWVFSSQSVLPRPRGIPGFDKAMHFAAYAFLAAALNLWFPRKKRGCLQALVLTACIASVYGIIDEIHQYFVPGRNCSFWDWTADTLGAAAGAGAALAVWRFIIHKNGQDQSGLQNL
ncbi:MAG: VanZ family protein [Treponema sp.]|nr:VanZ family protein [Treponema sp.]